MSVDQKEVERRVKNFRCIICDTVGDWKNVDEHRLVKKGMCLCNKCGMVAYPSLYENEEAMLEYYRKDYRKPPTMGNIYTGQRKLHYHAAFLPKVIDGWKKEGKDKPVIGEVGAAFGMTLNWFKGLLPLADLNGTEITLSYRRNGYHEFGLNLAEEFDYSKKYDLIASYKVLEHQMDADKKLRGYVECLKEDGRMYISVPTWMHILHNFGSSGFDIEYYYHTNHVNVWSTKLFETLLKKCGLEIVKEDHVMYDDTYLCKRNDKLMDEQFVYENPKEILLIMGKIKKAATLALEMKFEEAVGIYPNFPWSWKGLYEQNRAKYDQLGFPILEKEIIDKLKHHLPTDALALATIADILMRYNYYDAAIDTLKFAIECRPGTPEYYHNLSHCYRSMAQLLPETDKKGRAELLLAARDVSRQLKGLSLSSITEATNWIFHDNSNIPTPFEEEQHAK